MEPISVSLDNPCHQTLTGVFRSAIFYNSPSQKDTAQRVTEEVQKKHFDPYSTKITTQIIGAGTWFDAENYHQLYLFKNLMGYQCSTHQLHW